MMKKKIVVILIIISFIPILSVNVVKGNMASQDEIYGIAVGVNESLQKPNWEIGDYWNYEGNYSVSEETSFENMSVKIETNADNVSLNLSVENIETINIQGKNFTCYKTKMITSSSGRISITGNLGGKPINYNGNFDIKGNGYLYFTTSRLAVAKNDLTINISTDIPLPNMPSGAMNAIMEYSPPLNFMDFPVENGEKWTASSNVTVYYGEISSTNPVKFSFECIGKQGSMYIIKSDYNPFEEVIPLNNTLIFWNNSIGMIKIMRDTGEINQSLNLEISNYSYSNLTNETIILKVNPEKVTTPLNKNISFDLVIDKLPSGLSGYNITFNLFAWINATQMPWKIISVDFPSWASLNDYDIVSNNLSYYKSLWIKAIDLYDQIKANATNVTLATITIRPETIAGNGSIALTINELDDDNGYPINVITKNATLHVINLLPLPGCNIPTDINKDGLYEDINGNGLIDFDDVVEFFQYMEWIEQNWPFKIVDFNSNNLIDFDDIVELFKEV